VALEKSTAERRRFMQFYDAAESWRTWRSLYGRTHIFAPKSGRDRCQYIVHGERGGPVAAVPAPPGLLVFCRVLEIPEKGVALETLISELAKRDVLTALKAKRARAAAGLRTSAAHARWEEIQLTDVKPVIDFTRELMLAHLE
jgi:hypothetical protein